MKRMSLILAMVLAAGMTFALAQDGGPQGQPPGGMGMGPGGPGMGPGRQSGLTPVVQLIRRKDVQADLKLTDDQKTKITALLPKRPSGGPGGPGGPGGQGGQGGFGGGGDQGMGFGGGDGQGGFGGGDGQGDPPPPPPSMDAPQDGMGQGGPGQGGPGGQGGPPNMQQMQAQMKKAEEGIAKILTADQNKRLKEIQVQVSGNKAILDKTIQKELEITSAQKTKIQDLQTNLQDANRSVMDKAMNGEIERDEIRTIMEKNDKTFDTSLGKILTETQAAKLKKMGGATFKADPKESKNQMGGRPPF